MQTQNKYNPFQRNNSNNRSDGPRGEHRGNGHRGGYRGGYHSWKNQTVQPEPPKEKVLTADDFPALPTATLSIKRVPDKNSWEKTETSMAQRMKEQIEQEEQNRIRIAIEEKEEKLDVIPLSSWMRSKYLAKKRAEVEKKREIEAEEENYQWQISPEMVREEEEVEMPELGEDEEEEERYDDVAEEQIRELRQREVENGW